MKVYIAFDGDYSSRGAFAVFSSAAKAHEASTDVEEHELDELAVFVKQTVFCAEIYLTDGSQRGLPSDREEFCAPNLRESRVSEYYGSVYSGCAIEAAHAVDGVVSFALGRSTQSPEEALKLAAEARQAWLREMATKAGDTEMLDLLDQK